MPGPDSPHFDLGKSLQGTAQVPGDKAMADYLMKALPATMAGMDKAVVDLVKK